MVVAGVVTILGTLTHAVAPGPGVLMLARGVQGLAMGVTMAVSSVALAGAVPARPATVTALLVTLTAIVGATVGPIGAGILADAFGGTLAPMLGAAAAVAAAVVLLVVHGCSPAPDPRGGPDAGPLHRR